MNSCAPELFLRINGCWTLGAMPEDGIVSANDYVHLHAVNCLEPAQLGRHGEPTAHQGKGAPATTAR